ncbi:MAG: 4-(cytidine 5'-diphospho)-2-C-methyl-D-erythritol kinase, partial [Chloroflexota bacterium]|nr:4-(cytidine 5'-diphospho)-2-C-methyl-D-erythritol kinase [Chloroflexota bacterium]
MPETLTGLAPAKINLTLEVGATRPDGYHELTSILQTLALADEVMLEPAAATSIENTGSFADGSPAGPENLAWRAVDALAGAGGGAPPPPPQPPAAPPPAARGRGGGGGGPPPPPPP